MNLDAIHISFSNLFADGLNAISFSLIGMSIVFTGLLIISLYIAFLPKLLAHFEKGPAKTVKKVETTPTEESKEEEILLAIATALHIEQTEMQETQKVTWDYKNSPTGWRDTGISHNLTLRHNMTLRN
jgi:Na+-transporting methylmalonyl-CoA/oxaloacetate decarboxylase gamma subunit